MNNEPTKKSNHTLNLNRLEEFSAPASFVAKTVDDLRDQSNHRDSMIKFYVNKKNYSAVVRLAEAARKESALSVEDYVQYLNALNNHNQTDVSLELINALDRSLLEDHGIKLQIARTFVQDKQYERSASLSRELLIHDKENQSAGGLLILSLTLLRQFDDLFNYIAGAPPKALLADWAVLAMCTHYKNTPLGHSVNVISAIKSVASARAPKELLWSLRLKRLAGVLPNIDLVNLDAESEFDDELKIELALCLASSVDWVRGKDLYREFSNKDQHRDSKLLAVWHERYQLLHENYSNEIFDQHDYKFPDSIFEVMYRSIQTQGYTPIKGRVALINGTMGGGGAEKGTARTFLQLRDHSDFQPELWLYSTNPALDHDVVLKGLGIEESENLGVFILRQDESVETPLKLLPAPFSFHASAIYHQILTRKPEIVHAWEDSVNLEAAVAAILAGVQKIIIHPHNMRPDTVHKTKYVASFRRAYKELLRRPEIQFIAVSHSAAADYKSWLGEIEDKPLNVVYNGFEWKDFPAEQSIRDIRANFRENLGLPSETKLIGGIFRFAALKRPFFWIDVAHKLAQTNSEIRFILFGKGDELENVKSYAHSLGLVDKIYFLGYVQTIDTDIFALDALLHTSETEGLPTVIIEAGSAGIPVVSTDVGGVAECADPENSVLLSINKDCAQFSEALNNKLLRPLSYQARFAYATKIRNTFKIQEMLRKLKDIYQC